MNLSAKMIFIALALLLQLNISTAEEIKNNAQLKVEDKKTEPNSLCYYNSKHEKICYKFKGSLKGAGITGTGTSGGGCGGSSACGSNNYEIEWLERYKEANPDDFDKKNLQQILLKYKETQNSQLLENGLKGM